MLISMHVQQMKYVLFFYFILKPIWTCVWTYVVKVSKFDFILFIITKKNCINTVVTLQKPLYATYLTTDCLFCTKNDFVCYQDIHGNCWIGLARIPLCVTKSYCQISNSLDQCSNKVNIIFLHLKQTNKILSFKSLRTWIKYVYYGKKA